MNPITMLRELAESYAEGERVKAFGFGYKERAERARLENEGLVTRNKQAALDLEQDPAAFAKEQELSELEIKARREALTEKELARAAELKAAMTDSSNGTPIDPATKPEEAIADWRSRSLKIEREKETVEQNARVRQEQEARNANLGPASRSYLGVSPDDQVSATDLEVLMGKRREEAAVRAAQARASYGLSPSDPTSQAAVKSAADRVASGEITIGEARSLLGGVRGGLGKALLAALEEKRVIPPAVRKDLSAVQITRNIVDQMEELVEDVVNAKTPEDRAEATLLLEQYGNATGTLMSRGFGERGVVTDVDVKRATGLVPGWKAANFNPDYARQEIALLKKVLDRNEQGIAAGYFQVQNRNTGEVTKGASAGAVEEYVRDPKTGKLVLKKAAQ